MWDQTRNMVAAALVSGALLGGCSGYSLPDLMALHAVDPMTTDPAKLRLAVSLPDALDIPAGRLNFTGRITGTEGRPDKVHRFSVTRVASGVRRFRRARGAGGVGGGTPVATC